MSFETPDLSLEKKSVFDIDGLVARLEAKAEDPTFQEKCVDLLKKYGEKLKQPMIAFVTALALSLSGCSVAPQKLEGISAAQTQSRETQPLESELVGMTAEEYRVLSPEDQLAISREHSDGMINAIKTRNKELFWFHIGEQEKFVATIVDEEQRAEIQENLNILKGQGKIFFFFSK